MTAVDRFARLLLTMLALVAGLGSAPVQARVAAADAAEIERVESALGVATVAYAVVEVRGRTSADCPEKGPRKPKPTTSTVVLIPSIQFGDRARE